MGRVRVHPPVQKVTWGQRLQARRDVWVLEHRVPTQHFKAVSNVINKPLSKSAAERILALRHEVEPSSTLDAWVADYAKTKGLGRLDWLPTEAKFALYVLHLAPPMAPPKIKTTRLAWDREVRALLERRPLHEIERDARQAPLQPAASFAYYADRVRLDPGNQKARELAYRSFDVQSFEAADFFAMELKRGDERVATLLEKFLSGGNTKPLIAEQVLENAGYIALHAKTVAVIDHHLELGGAAQTPAILALRLRIGPVSDKVQTAMLNRAVHRHPDARVTWLKVSALTRAPTQGEVHNVKRMYEQRLQHGYNAIESDALAQLKGWIAKWE